jgi:hypothetical protein
MFPIEFDTQVAAATRLAEKATRTLVGTSSTVQNAERLLKGSATGPGGAAVLSYQEVASLLLMFRQIGANHSSAIDALLAATSLFQTEMAWKDDFQ